MTILNQAGLILQQHVLDGRAFLQLLQVAISTASLSYIPESLDCITVGSADRIRPANPRVVFVIGANQGVFPASPSTSGVFNDLDRHRLSDFGAELTETLDRQIINERYSAYTALSSASERLFVSYSAADTGGGMMLPSEIVSEMRRVFPDLMPQPAQRLPKEPEFLEEAFETLALSLENHGTLSKLLCEDFSRREDYQDTLKALERAEKIPVHFENAADARRFFGNTMNLSASQVETYYQCPFRYFCRYGMRAGTLRKAKIDALEYGTMIHWILEAVLHRYPEKEALLALDEETVRREVEALLEEYLETNFGGRTGKSKRFLRIYARYAAVAQELVQGILADFRQNRFEPVDAELSIGAPNASDAISERQIPSLELPLPGDGRIRVFGKVDRVDQMVSGDRHYIRIIDYKTGTKEFALTDVLFGLDMQMVIYLLTITERGRERYGEIVPAGVLYVPARTIHVPAMHSEKKETVQERRQKALRMSGIVRNEEEVIRGMEPNVTGKFIPVRYKKDQTPDVYSQVISPEEMNVLFRYVLEKLGQMGTQLQSGKIPKQPIQKACRFCEFAGVCGHEPGDAAYELPDLKNSQVLEAMRKDLAKEKKTVREIDPES